MPRLDGEENFSDREVEVLDLTDQWHEGLEDSSQYSLTDWVAHKLGVSRDEAGEAIYGPHWKNGAVL